MTTTKNARAITNALLHAYTRNNHSITISTKESEPIEFIGNGFSGTLPKGRIVLNTTNYNALLNQKEGDIKLQIVACPEDIEFELSMGDKEFTIPMLKDAKILSQNEIFKSGDIVSAEISSDDYYGITTYRNRYIGKVILTDYRGVLDLATYSRLGSDSEDVKFENFSVSARYFRLSSALEMLYGSNTKAYLKASYVGRKDGLAILPLKETRLSANGAVLGILADGSEVSLADNIVYFDHLSQESLQETVKAKAANHPLKGSGYLRARRLRHT